MGQSVNASGIAQAVLIQIIWIQLLDSKIIGEFIICKKSLCSVKSGVIV